MVKRNLTTLRGNSRPLRGFFFNALAMFTYLVQKSDELTDSDLKRRPSERPA